MAFLGVSGFRIRNKKNQEPRFAAAVIVLALSVVATQRARVLASDETLWRDTLAKNPAAWCAHNNLGCILAEQKQYAEAKAHFAASLQSNPRDSQAHRNLANVLVIEGKLAEAEGQFAVALAIKPDAETHLEFAKLLHQQDKARAAATQYPQVLA